MSLLLSVVGMVVAATTLVAATAARALRRRDHRCTEQSRPSSCTRCAAVLRGEDRGGHLACACGAVSPHLAGADLLAWRAEHYGETLPALPGAGAVGEVDREVRSTTRSRAASEAEEGVRRALAEELGETQRRMIDRARRRPDPITPQLLREAEDLGMRPPAEDRPVTDAEDRPVTDAVDRPVTDAGRAAGTDSPSP